MRIENREHRRHLFAGDRERYLNVFYGGRPYEGSVKDLLFNPALFERLSIVSYSVGDDYVVDLIEPFKKVRLLLGLDEGIGQTILSYRTGWDRELLERERLREMYFTERLEVRFMPDVVVHSKIYLCEGAIKRVAIGSANLTRKAFEGKQYEELIVFDDEDIFDFYFQRFESLWAKSVELIERKKRQEVKEEVLKISVSREEEGLSEVQFKVLLDGLLQAGKKISLEGDVIEIFKHQIEEKRQELKEEEEKLQVLEEVLDSVKYDVKERKFVPKQKKELTELARKLFLKKSRKVIESPLRDRPVLVLERGRLYRIEGENAVEFAVEEPDREMLSFLLEKVENFMNFYPEFAEGTEAYRQASKGFEAVLYAFTGPFLWKLRKLVYENFGETNATAIPYFFVIGGRANSGKSKLLEFIAELTGNRVYAYRTELESKGEDLIKEEFRGNNLMPLLADEVEKKFWTGSGYEFIKSYTKTQPGPSLICTTNYTREAGLKPEIIKRIYYLNFSNPLREERREQYIRYYQEKVGQVNDYLFRVFCGLFEVREEDLDRLLKDPLYFSRQTFLKMYEMAGRKVPDYFPQERFSYEIHDPELWRVLYREKKDIFSKTVYEGEECLIVSFEDYERDRDIEYWASRLPDHIIKQKAPRMLIIREKGFLDFIGIGEKSVWWKRFFR